MHGKVKYDVVEIKMKKNIEQTTCSKVNSKTKKWVVLLLLASSVVQLYIMNYNFETDRLQKLQGSLEKDEYYGIINQNLHYIVEDRLFAYQSYLNTFEVLKKIAKSHLSPNDLSTIDNNIRIARDKTKFYIGSNIVLLYLMSHDQGPSKEQQESWKKLNEKEQQELANEFQDKNSRYFGSIKARMVENDMKVNKRSENTRILQFISFGFITLCAILVFLSS